MSVTGVSPAGAAGPNVTQVAAPTTRVGCARMSDGTVTCSGQNENGELGDGGANDFTLGATQVKNTAGSGPLTGVAQVVNGNFFSCARLASGGVVCWGNNQYGQLGNGTKNNTSIPIAVKNTTGTGPLTGVAQIAAGKYHACARLANGTVDCWGHNGYNELGDNTVIEHLLPHPVVNSAGHPVLTGQVNISASQYGTCSVQSDGSARCWGVNTYGNIGDGTIKPRAIPTRVKAPSGSGFLAKVASISMAPNHTCALLKTGTMLCWGLNTVGQLGDGTTTQRLRPVVVKNVPGTAALVHIAQISAAGGNGGDHTCAMLVAKTALCWGDNFYGQIGDGSKTNRHRPVIVKATSGAGPLTGVLTLVTGSIATCATTTAGTKCWGFNSGGQFGNGTAQSSTRPVSARP